MLNKRRKMGRQPVLSTQRSCGGDPTRCAVLRSVLAVAPNKNKDVHCEGVAGTLCCFWTLSSKHLILSPPRLFTGSFGTSNGPESAPRTASKNGSQNA